MTALAISRWTLLRTWRSPWTWCLLALSALAWPLLEHLTPISVSSESGDLGVLAYEFAFLGALCGATLGLSSIGAIAPVLARADAGARTTATMLAVGLPAALLALVAAAWPWMRGAVGEGGIGLGLLLAAGRLGALGALLAALPLSASARSLLLWLLAWIVPAWVATSSLPGRWASALLDVSATLRTPPEGWSPASLLAGFGPMMGLYLAARLSASSRSAPSARPS